MARLKPKEFDPTFFLKIKKEKEKILGDALKISAEPYSDRPLTPKEVEEKQKNLPPGSPYEPGKSPIPSSPNLAHFLTPSGSGKTLSDEWYEKGVDTIMETTEPGYTRDERMRILNHQYLDQVKNPQSGLMISHHTGGKHFTEPSMDELIEGLIKGDIPRGTLGDEETENRMIREYKNKQSLKIKGA